MSKMTHTLYRVHFIEPRLLLKAGGAGSTPLTRNFQLVRAETLEACHLDVYGHKMVRSRKRPIAPGKTSCRLRNGDVVNEIASKTRPRAIGALVSSFGLNNVNTLKPELVGSWRMNKGGQAVGDVEADSQQVDIGGLLSAPLGCAQAGRTECMRKDKTTFVLMLTREISRLGCKWLLQQPNTEINKVSGESREVSADHSTLRWGKPITLQEDKGKGLAGPMNTSCEKGALDVQSE